MPRYYFHIQSGGSLTRDEEGIEFSTLAEAVEDAIRSATNFARDAESHGVPADTVIQVADAFGTILHAVPVFGEPRH